MLKFEIDYKLVGERIKESRLNKNMNQDTLAYLVEVNASFISNIERGKTKMSTETLANIASYFDVHLDNYTSEFSIELFNSIYKENPSELKIKPIDIFLLHIKYIIKT